jgi:hypothetical protein
MPVSELHREVAAIALRAATPLELHAAPIPVA